VECDGLLARPLNVPYLHVESCVEVPQGDLREFAFSEDRQASSMPGTIRVHAFEQSAIDDRSRTNKLHNLCSFFHHPSSIISTSPSPFPSNPVRYIILLTMTDALNDISAADWGKGIALSILASLIGGASKLAIRKSWLIVVENDDEDDDQDEPEPENGFHDETSPPQALSLDTASVTSSEENYPVYTQGQDDSRRWKWWAPLVLRYSGMLGMSVLNPVCCVLAMNYASPSILAPFSGLTLVWVILLAQAVVGEKPSSAQVTACCLIIVGEVIVAVFGDHTNNVDQSADDVVRPILRFFNLCNTRF
jgi:hypothetical protein